MMICYSDYIACSSFHCRMPGFDKTENNDSADVDRREKNYDSSVDCSAGLIKDADRSSSLETDSLVPLLTRVRQTGRKTRWC